MRYRYGYLYAGVGLALVICLQGGRALAATDAPVASDAPNVVVIKEDPRLAKKLSLGPEVKTVTLWGEAIHKATEIPLVLPTEAKDKELFLNLKDQTLKRTLDSVAASLRLQWKLKSDQAVFEPLPPSERLDDLADMLPQQARELLEMPTDERNMLQMTSGGDFLNHLSPQDWQALGKGGAVDLESLSPDAQRRAMTNWFIPQLMSFDQLLQPSFGSTQGKLSLEETGNDYRLSLLTQGNSGDSEYRLIATFPKTGEGVPFDPKELPTPPPPKPRYFPNPPPPSR